jgi:hypothetical protein
VLALLATLAGAPWYSRSECLDAAHLIYRGQSSEARRSAEAMTASHDLDLHACGLWLSATLIEMEMALSDDEERLLEEMEKRLDALEAFGRDQTEQRFADLVLEAKLRRTRLLVLQGHRAEAVSVAKDAQKILEKRRTTRNGTPTYFYAEAIANLAITHADFYIRAVLRLVGLTGDEERGKKAMKILLDKPSIYRAEAMIVARSFTTDDSDLFGPPVNLSAELAKGYPSNPQLAFDHAWDLAGLEKCDAAREAIAPFDSARAKQSSRLNEKLDRVVKICPGGPSSKVVGAPR